MMNTVGAIVINVLGMLGRVTETRAPARHPRLLEERLQGKVAEFQEKYEFNRINSTAWAAFAEPLRQRRKC